MLQITIGDELPFGVLSQPAFAVPQQFFHFGITDPIVLVVIEHWNQHVEMRQAGRSIELWI